MRDSIGSHVVSVNQVNRREGAVPGRGPWVGTDRATLKIFIEKAKKGDSLQEVAR